LKGEHKHFGTGRLSGSTKNTKNTQDLPRTSLGILLPVTPPVPGGPGTQRQHCRRDLTSRCKTLVRRHSPRSWSSPPQFLRKADMCSRQTGRIQNARRRQRSAGLEHRAAGKTELRQCQSGFQWRRFHILGSTLRRIDNMQDRGRPAPWHCCSSPTAGW